MKERVIDNEITLIPYYRNDEVALPWYQDPDVCKQVDNRDEPYTLELLHCMYDFLSTHGACFYIEYQGRCVLDMLALAREKDMKTVKANIYSFNKQSQMMFQSVGFEKTEEEWYEYRL